LADDPVPNSIERYRQIYVYEVATGIRIPKYSNIGLVDPSRGKVYLRDIKFDLSNKIRITVKPDSFDIAPKYNQLVNIYEADITVTAEQDTVSVLGSTGLSNYKTFPRH
jgi:hypothetical protein